MLTNSSGLTNPVADSRIQAASDALTARFFTTTSGPNLAMLLPPASGIPSATDGTPARWQTECNPRRDEKISWADDFARSFVPAMRRTRSTGFGELRSGSSPEPQRLPKVSRTRGSSTAASICQAVEAHKPQTVAST